MFSRAHLVHTSRHERGEGLYPIPTIKTRNKGLAYQGFTVVFGRGGELLELETQLETTLGARGMSLAVGSSSMPAIEGKRSSDDPTEVCSTSKHMSRESVPLDFIKFCAMGCASLLSNCCGRMASSNAHCSSGGTAWSKLQKNLECVNRSGT